MWTLGHWVQTSVTSWFFNINIHLFAKSFTLWFGRTGWSRVTDREEEHTQSRAGCSSGSSTWGCCFTATHLQHGVLKLSVYSAYSAAACLLTLLATLLLLPPFAVSISKSSPPPQHPPVDSESNLPVGGVCMAAPLCAGLSWMFPCGQQRGQDLDTNINSVHSLHLHNNLFHMTELP